MNHEEIVERLRNPFSSKDVEWKVQVTAQGKEEGMVVAYLDARTVQNRLDEVVGPFNWKNVYSLWHDNSQICGISIFNSERNEWVTKYDGAECSDIQPIKGGLSDSFKRAAIAWGIGRYLYSLGNVWVELEPKGKSFVIKKNQYSKLESEYNAAVKRIFGNAASHNPPIQQSASPTLKPDNISTVQAPVEDSVYDYKVQSVNPSGKSSQVLELIGNDGKLTKAYIKTGDRSIVAGSRLRGVQIERKNSSHGDYNLINSYQLAA